MVAAGIADGLACRKLVRVMVGVIRVRGVGLRWVRA
jgi:hypothetical protein